MMGGGGGFIGDVVGGVTDVVGTVTPWNDESTMGSIATNLAIGAATGGVAASYGAGLVTAVSAGGLAAAGYSALQVSQERLEDQSIDLQREQLERAREEERRKRAASRRAAIAQQMLQGAVTYNPMDTAAEKRNYENKVPSLGNIIDMSGD